MSRLSGFHGCLDRGAQYASACYAQPLAKLLSLLKSALVGGAVLGLIQPAFAVGDLSFGQGSSSQVVFPKSGQGIYAALLDLDGAKAKPVAAQRGDDALAALEGFARTVVSESKAPVQKVAASRQDDAVYAELADFAKRVGVKPTVSQEPRLKLAQADNAVDALKDFLRGNGTPAPVVPQAQRRLSLPGFRRRRGLRANCGTRPAPTRGRHARPFHGEAGAHRALSARSSRSRRRPLRRRRARGVQRPAPRCFRPNRRASVVFAGGRLAHRGDHVCGAAAALVLLLTVRGGAVLVAVAVRLAAAPSGRGRAGKMLDRAWPVEQRQVSLVRAAVR